MKATAKRIVKVKPVLFILLVFLTIALFLSARVPGRGKSPLRSAAKVDDWREFLGVTSRRHDHQSLYPVKAVAPKHKVLSDVPAEWTEPKDELYIIEKVWPKTTVLAGSTNERDGTTHPVVWTNRYGKARVFGTTFGHSDEMFTDPIFIKLQGNGIRRAATGN